MKLSHHYYVYIVECKDGSYYTGITNDYERRLWEHNTGFDERCYTYKRRPVELKYCIEVNDVMQAIEWEKQIKGLSRKKKQALFTEDWDKIRQLAKSSASNAKLNNPSINSGCQELRSTIKISINNKSSWQIYQQISSA